MASSSAALLLELRTCRVESATQALPSQMLNASLISEGSVVVSDTNAQPSARPSACGVKAHC